MNKLMPNHHVLYSIVLTSLVCFMNMGLWGQPTPGPMPSVMPATPGPMPSVMPATPGPMPSVVPSPSTPFTPGPMPSVVPSPSTPSTPGPMPSAIPSTPGPMPSVMPSGLPTFTPTTPTDFEPPTVQEIDQDELDFLQDPEIESQDVESFYGSFGFNLIPRKKQFTWRNIVRNSIYFNNNVYYDKDSGDRDAVSDTVYLLSLESQLEYKPLRHLEISLNAGVGFEQYFGESQSNLLPRIQLDVRFKEGIFYATFKDRIIRNTALITGEVNEFSLWWRNNINLTLGMVYDRFLFEVSNTHEWKDYDDLSGDHQFYGQLYTVGYRFAEGIYGTAAYAWDRIDYDDAYSLSGRKLLDSTGHSFLVGLRMEKLIQLARNMGIYCGTGLQERRDHWYWRVFLTLDWKFMEFETRRFKVDFTMSQQTQPSMLGDFRLTTSGNLVAKYLITRNWAVTGDITMAYNDPLDASISLQYIFEASTSYRLMQGIDLEASYRFSMVTSNDVAQEYQQHIMGVSMTVIF